MHFAMPPRKTSRPPPYALRSQQSSLPIPPALKNLMRRDKLRLIVGGIVGLSILWWLLVGGSSHEDGAAGALFKKAAVGTGPPVVIVTVIDTNADRVWTDKIKRNRQDYARKHGYLTFFPNNTQYPISTRDVASPATWSKVPALRHAMTLFPSSSFLWYLDSTALIMNPGISLHNAVLAPTRLEKTMIVNEPVVPPDSVIRTFGNLKGDRIDFVVTQDQEGLTPTSMVVRNGEWAKYFLDAWFDPIYRSYNFQKAESHALEHIVQWHGTILAKLALLPQNKLNSYASGPANSNNGQYKDGDLVANFPGCARGEKNNCDTEQAEFWKVLEDRDRS